MFDVVDLLNVRLRANPLWRKLAEVVEDYINATVGAGTDQAMNAIGNPYRYLRGDNVDPRTMPDIVIADGSSGAEGYVDMLTNRERVANVRVVFPTDDNCGSQLYVDIDGTTYVSSQNRFHDRDILIKEAQQLGFDYYSDDLTDADYARILTFISQYWPRAGSQQAFEAFIGFIHDLRIKVVQLWTSDDGTDDYNVLERYNPQMVPVWKGGKHYPSFHYDLQYDAFSNITPDSLYRLFYALAPINLVLRRMVETVRAEPVLYSTGVNSLNVTKRMVFAPQTISQQGSYRYTISSNIVGVPVQIAYPLESNLTINGMSLGATGGGFWILERDPASVYPANPADYMRKHGIYIRHYNKLAKVKAQPFNFPVYGVWSSGLWGMSDTVGATIGITVT